MRPTISLTQFLFAVACAAVAVKLSLYGYPGLLVAPLMYLALVFRPPNRSLTRLGLCIELLGCGILIQTQYIWYWYGGEFFLEAVLNPLNALAVVAMLVGAFCALSDNDRNSPSWTFAPTAATLTCGAFAAAIFLGVSPYLDYVRQERQQDERQVARAVMDTFASDVQTACQQLGRTPASREEIENQLSRPLPSLLINRKEIEIEYSRINATRYSLFVSLGMYDSWRYDSSAPQPGWQTDNR